MAASAALPIRLTMPGRSDLLQQLAAVLEVQLNSLSDLEAPPTSYGITDESFENICAIQYAAPLLKIEDLPSLSISELKQLVYAHRLDDTACIEKLHLIELLGGHALERSQALQSEEQPAAESAAGIGAGGSATLAVKASHPFDLERRKSLPQQCAICMADFRDADRLKVLPCSDLHAFHTDCIQKWLDKHTSCPLCRTECGERRPPPLQRVR